MQTLWFILVALMLTIYVILDGFDLGAGIIHLFAARNEDERRAILQAIGPIWDGNEVWLIAAGGTLFFAFPLLYASSFSGFYLPLIIVLWLLMLRGIAIELRSHIPSSVWRSFWDGTFFIGSALLAIFFGAALGNVIRGVPLNPDNYFFVALWTDFNPYSSNPGVLDWYTILIGLLALAVLTAHGSSYIAVKTEGDLNARARRIARWAWIATIVLGILGTIASFSVQPLIRESFSQRPWEIIFPLIALAGLAGMGYFNLKRNDLPAFFSSAIFILGMLSSAASSLYPTVLPSVTAVPGLTIASTSSSLYGQTVGLIWWSLGILLAIIYFTITYRLFWGKVKVTREPQANTAKTGESGLAG
ncbi:cytochrome d ubiquinol oxidase subunit II [Dictyobacter arantiisoli]|uniref:Cytochrome oxidase d subunit II n=1 Tax=Dictyobacter arantiisoli TaxID=2014874 RepID=A0A5A5TKH7_9CHLR|nr:cytochrome d ubiquinol oxidase subunit II [Dictyobacter arantiisoli]GCF11586.1 cytochrome oxidase d subunit II [Dictyobacter arantiisoli]